MGRGALVLLLLLALDGGDSSCLWPHRGSPPPEGNALLPPMTDGLLRTDNRRGDLACPSPLTGGEAAPAIAMAQERHPHAEKGGRAVLAGWVRKVMLCFGRGLRDTDLDEMSSHRLWEKLDERDDLERVRLALSTLSEVAEERHMMEKPQDVIEIKGVDSGGLHLEGESLGDIRKMLETLNLQRQRLHVDSFQQILDRVAPLLRDSPNIVVIPKNQSITVVGDIHGSLNDLFRIFQLRGWPGPGNTFVFNGDFVDRGDKGVEVIATLFALKAAVPDHVLLNRGNHEDEHIGRAYGFFDEVMSKYGSVTLYDKIQDVFALLPLCTIIEDEVFVVHAGISRVRGTNLGHIAGIDRARLRTTVKAASDAQQGKGHKLSARNLFLVEDLLWSDPANPALDPGSERDMEPNAARGAGTRYGSGYVRDWLRKNGLKTLVRSHQCMPKGWDKIDCGQGTACYTVFSASDYDSGGNDGAVLVFEPGSMGTPTVIEYQSTPETNTMRSRNRQRLVDLICGHKAELRVEFKRVAGRRRLIRVGEWAEALQRVLQLKVDFRPLRLELVGMPLLVGHTRHDMVDWALFLDRYRIEVTIPGGGGESSSVQGEVVKDKERPSIEAIFKHRRELAVVFRILDLNGDGTLGMEEVGTACELVNKNLPEGRKIDAEDLFRIMDSKGTGTVSVDDFALLWKKTH
uniref:Serine/threonine-protein phosphatase n=1 Tax=Hemiselmis andersenii TaxID=464988 RepID=A0A7S1HG69_HEMAN|mmetsp:Transcript_58103/g.140068  ORF Transcript_58103/g.140068 Transcript_58103/m.140068 type:complete len:686 (+) Transcript_58103:68-2125(+)